MVASQDFGTLLAGMGRCVWASREVRYKIIIQSDSFLNMTNVLYFLCNISTNLEINKLPKLLFIVSKH